jgi:hypothetical protein
MPVPETICVDVVVGAADLAIILLVAEFTVMLLLAVLIVSSLPTNCPGGGRVIVQVELNVTLIKLSKGLTVYVDALTCLTVPLDNEPVILVIPVSKTSSDGKPEISLTLNTVPVNPSAIENSCPAVASKLTVPSSAV